jgi:hypothetical protein
VGPRGGSVIGEVEVIAVVVVVSSVEDVVDNVVVTSWDDDDDVVTVVEQTGSSGKQSQKSVESRSQPAVGIVNSVVVVDSLVEIDVSDVSSFVIVVSSMVVDGGGVPEVDVSSSVVSNEEEVHELSN